MGLGRLELPTSRLSDMSWALVGARQRWWAMLQVVLQPQTGVTGYFHRESEERGLTYLLYDRTHVTQRFFVKNHQLSVSVR